MRFLHRLFYNQEEFVYFDSDVGKYIAKTEFGKPVAVYYNNDKDYIDQMRMRVETFCKNNYEVAKTAGITGRKAQPEVVVSVMPCEDTSTVHHILLCYVFGFYPSKVEVKWYRNGQVETDQVQSSALFHNGDWTSQILVMLETEIQRGDTFTCEVQHSSLGAPHRVDWNPQVSDSAKSKNAAGIGGFVLGTIVLLAGIGMYMKGQKDQTLLRVPQNEQFIPVS
ncbi:rano class II histocompatibility antigen, D-1 beta chain-like isoform X2 [Dendropsophus ebraccatus]